MYDTHYVWNEPLMCDMRQKRDHFADLHCPIDIDVFAYSAP